MESRMICFPFSYVLDKEGDVNGKWKTKKFTSNSVHYSRVYKGGERKKNMRISLPVSCVQYRKDRMENKRINRFPLNLVLGKDLMSCILYKVSTFIKKV